eukprot:gene199-2964_t
MPMAGPHDEDGNKVSDGIVVVTMNYRLRAKGSQ